jgi:type IV secretion system protein VirB9
MKRIGALLLTCAAAPAFAQVSTTPGPDDPRLQTLVQPQGQRARLVVFPEASLTLILRQGERVRQVALSDSSAFHVAITGDNDSISISPLREGAVAAMNVETNNGEHEFDLETGRGLAAAYVVRMIGSNAALARTSAPAPPPDLAAMPGRYSLKGDQTIRPAKIADDGAKTYIEWGAGQPLPAVLGVGATGQEEVVPGYMRDGVFTIDRVYSELVFRMDRQKTIASREINRGPQ